MVNTTRSVFDKQLNDLQIDVLKLSELVTTQALQATKALQKRDMSIAHRVDEFDATINRIRYEVEERSYTLLALQQPNARDMRRIVASVSVVTNLERMGDHAAGIARLVLRMEHLPSTLYVPEFDDMAELSAINLTDAMRALTEEDVALARSIVNRDDQIDQLHQTIYDLLIETMAQDSSQIECATMLMWVSHNFERYADRISNICERIVYMVTGGLNEPRPDSMP
ncbi:MAG: phosphate signaling complex protein PhoU [Chloroflexota bacterium]